MAKKSVFDKNVTNFTGSQVNPLKCEPHNISSIPPGPAEWRVQNILSLKNLLKGNGEKAHFVRKFPINQHLKREVIGVRCRKCGGRYKNLKEIQFHLLVCIGRRNLEFFKDSVGCKRKIIKKEPQGIIRDEVKDGGEVKDESEVKDKSEVKDGGEMKTVMGPPALKKVPRAVKKENLLSRLRNTPLKINRDPKGNREISFRTQFGFKTIRILKEASTKLFPRRNPSGRQPPFTHQPQPKVLSQSFLPSITMPLNSKKGASSAKSLSSQKEAITLVSLNIEKESTTEKSLTCEKETGNSMSASSDNDDISSMSLWDEKEAKISVSLNSEKVISSAKSLNSDEEAKTRSRSEDYSPITEGFLKRGRTLGESMREKEGGSGKRNWRLRLKDKQMKMKKERGDVLLCPKCHYKTSVPIRLALHYSNHPVGWSRGIWCVGCGLWCGNKRKLCAHLSRCLSSFYYQCFHCRFSSALRRTMVVHVATSHRDIVVPVLKSVLYKYQMKRELNRERKQKQGYFGEREGKEENESGTEEEESKNGDTEEENEYSGTEEEGENKECGTKAESEEFNADK